MREKVKPTDEFVDQIDALLNGLSNELINPKDTSRHQFDPSNILSQKEVDLILKLSELYDNAEKISEMFSKLRELLYKNLIGFGQLMRHIKNLITIKKVSGSDCFKKELYKFELEMTELNKQTSREKEIDELAKAWEEGMSEDITDEIKESLTKYRHRNIPSKNIIMFMIKEYIQKLYLIQNKNLMNNTDVFDDEDYRQCLAELINYLNIFLSNDSEFQEMFNKKFNIK